MGCSTQGSSMHKQAAWQHCASSQLMLLQVELTTLWPAAVYLHGPDRQAEHHADTRA